MKTPQLRTTEVRSVHRTPACVLVFLALTSFGTSAFAQNAGVSIDAGALNMRYADTVNTSAIAVTPAFWTESRSGSLGATGTFSQFTGGGWSAQGSTDGSVFTPRKGVMLGELSGSGGGSSRNDGSRTAQLLGSARLHIAAANQGVWIGAGGGGTWDGDTWRKVQQGEAAAWARFGAATAFASATPVIVDDSIRYTDAQASLSFNLPRVELSGTGGFRSGSRLPTYGGTATSWGSVSAVMWIASRVALVATGGTYPVDLTQGFPGGRFASVSLRIGNRRSVPVSSSQSYDLGSLSSTDNAVGISYRSARQVESGVQEIRFSAPSAKTVEMMGDMTDWAPVQLQNAGNGIWTIALPVTAGIHEFNVRVDGGRWVAPPGLASRSDEFGGTVGLLVLR
jgi:1,4-alpha-glucan branching enzyme